MSNFGPLYVTHEILALVQGGQISCLQPSELAWYDWPRLRHGAALRAATALRAAGSVGTRLVLMKYQQMAVQNDFNSVFICSSYNMAVTHPQISAA